MDCSWPIKWTTFSPLPTFTTPQVIDDSTGEDDDSTITSRIGTEPREGAMNWAELQWDWKAASSLLTTHWAKLTDEDVEGMGGSRGGLAASLRRLYGYGEEEAERAIASFEKDVRHPGVVK